AAMNHLLVVAALDEEIDELRRRHPDVSVLVTGPGKVLAAAGLAAALATDRPAAVLVLGTAGALTPRHEGVHEIDLVTQHDFDSAAIAALVGRAYAGRIVLGPATDSADVAGRSALTHLATGDVFVADPAHVARLADLGFGLVDMEGYAYAHVCRSAGVPVRIVKAVSDSADGDAASTWTTNIRRCAVLLADWYDEQGGLPVVP
ncbi:MAG: nucleoside phosphorylase, partial [Frankiales bacterium]|nr:nucleoside phosphorylase [Frankiales bacterium]